MAVKLAAACGSVLPPRAPVRTSHVPWATFDSALPLGHTRGSLSLRGRGDGVRTSAGTLVRVRSCAHRPPTAVSDQSCRASSRACDQPRLQAHPQ